MILYAESDIREIYVSKPWGAFTNPWGEVKVSKFIPVNTMNAYGGGLEV